jgi:hypothetical protein
MTDKEKPNCWEKNQIHCSGRHLQSSAEENVWVQAEKVTVGRIKVRGTKLHTWFV